MWRTFIAGSLEMCRRLQWNFCAYLYPFVLLPFRTVSSTDRLENEHLGNMDQYRVTREVPLPYPFDDHSHETDIDEDDHRSVSSWRSRRKGLRSKTPQSDAQTKVQDMDQSTDI